MPNWCECDLSIRGDPAEIDRLIEERSGEHRNADGLVEKLWVDFYKIVPYPAEYRVWDEIVRVERKQVSVLVAGMTDEERKAFNARYAAANRAAIGDEWLKDGYNSGGYDWCCANWGTKWPAGDFWRPRRTRRCFRVSFNTPWSPALPVFEELSRLHPKLTISLWYFERGGAFKGKAVWRAGEVVEEGHGKYHGRRGG